jgi:hypothetical protein
MVRNKPFNDGALTNSRPDDIEIRTLGYGFWHSWAHVPMPNYGNKNFRVEFLGSCRAECATVAMCNREQTRINLAHIHEGSLAAAAKTAVIDAVLRRGGNTVNDTCSCQR